MKPTCLICMLSTFFQNNCLLHPALSSNPPFPSPLYRKPFTPFPAEGSNHMYQSHSIRLLLTFYRSFPAAFSTYGCFQSFLSISVSLLLITSSTPFYLFKFFICLFQGVSSRRKDSAIRRQKSNAPKEYSKDAH